MPQCVWKPCRQKLQSGWLFCPYCGTDNRPETFRPNIIACPHLFIEDEGFCVRCGSSRDGRHSAADRAKQAGLGKTAIKLGIFAAAASYGIQQIHDNHFTGNQLIAPWYEETTEVDGKKAFKGDDYVLWGETGGLGLVCLGIIILIIARVNAGRIRKRSKA